MERKNIKVIIAGGGTGGHVFPGVAIAEEFVKRDHGNTILFIGTRRGLEARILEDAGFNLATIDVMGIRGKGLLKSLGGLLRIPMSMIQSFSIIRGFSPDIVVGVGGYASGPAVVTAHWMGKKTAIAEQNAFPGLTNRILGRFADKIFVTFEETTKWFSKEKTVVTGNPVRADFISAAKKTGKEQKKFTLLIFGGSQGASAINRAVIDSLPFLEKMGAEIRIIHQTGVHDVHGVVKTYEAYRLDAEVCPFITDMASAYDAADLLICRAGATTVAEITASGKAAVLIPFRFAVGDHQRLNAEVLVNAGAAEMILEKDLEGETLAGTIERLFHDQGAIRTMEERSRMLGNGRAAAHIVDECLDLIRR